MEHIFGYTDWNKSQVYWLWLNKSYITIGMNNPMGTNITKGLDNIAYVNSPPNK